MRYQCRNPDEVKCIMYVIQSARDSAYMLVYKKRYFMVYTKKTLFTHCNVRSRDWRSMLKSLRNIVLVQKTEHANL